MTKRSEARKEFLHGVFTTALEGGIGYWSVCDTYNWAKGTDTKGDPCVVDLDGFYAIVYELDEDGEGVSHDRLGYEFHYDTKELRIDISVIARGVQLFTQYVYGRIDYQGNKVDDPKPVDADHYWRQFLKADQTNGDDGDYDSIVADNIVQFGLFGKVVYG